MSERVVVATLWVIAACMCIGWLAGLVSLRANEQDWSQVTPVTRTVPRPPSCLSVAKGAWCP